MAADAGEIGGALRRPSAFFPVALAHSLSLTRSLASRINTDGGGAEDRAAAADGDGAPAGRAQRGERPVPKERARPAVERARAELDQGADDDGGGEEINRAARGDGDTNAAQKVMEEEWRSSRVVVGRASVCINT